jgi:Holliday junction resolvase RusA-like endonuclease
MNPIKFSASGTPRPQPRPRLVKGRVVSVADANAKRWIVTVERAARLALDAHGVAGEPLDVTMVFRMPTKAKDRWGKPHTFRPDADNLAKLALDSMMRAGLIKDDSSVSSLVIKKTWAQEAGADFVVSIDSSVAPCAPYIEPPGWLAVSADAYLGSDHPKASWGKCGGIKKGTTRKNRPFWPFFSISA